MVRQICSPGTLIWLYRIIRWLLGGLFCYAGLNKLYDPEAFGVIIDAYGIVPDSLVIPLAVLLSTFEVVAAIGLIFDLRGSLASITSLLLLFIVILGYGIYIGIDVDCGCFGQEDPESRAYGSMRTSLYRDLVLLCGVLYLFWWRRLRNATLLRGMSQN